MNSVAICWLVQRRYIVKEQYMLTGTAEIYSEENIVMNSAIC